MVYMFVGYFIYDSLELFFSNRLLQDWGVTLHHIIVSTYSNHFCHASCVSRVYEYIHDKSTASQMRYVATSNNTVFTNDKKMHFGRHPDH